MMELDGEPVAAGELAALALHNYGHFTSILVHDGRVRGLSLHLDRLVRDCWTVHGVALDPDRVRALLRRVPPDGRRMVRVTVYDPAFDLGRPAATAAPRVLVTTRPAPPPNQAPIRLVTVAYVRELPHVKHTGLFGALSARRQAQRGGADDVLFVDRSDRVSEGATWSVGFLDGDDVVWPEAEVLSGVTQRLIGGERRSVTRRDAYQMMGFIANAGVGVRPIGSIDGHEPPLRAAAFEAVRQRYDAVAGEVP